MAYREHPDTGIHEAVLELAKLRPEWSPVQAATFIGGAVVATARSTATF
jgi:hypothetical protein